MTTSNNGKMMMPGAIKIGRRVVKHVFGRGGEKQKLRRAMRRRGSRNVRLILNEDDRRVEREIVESWRLW